MSNCLFCTLISEKKLNLLYEDDQVVAFPDIEPKAPTHILIVPRKHLGSLLEMEIGDEALIGHLSFVAQELAKKQGIAESGFRVLVNTGADAGQTVHHVHMHLMGGEKLSEL